MAKVEIHIAHGSNLFSPPVAEGITWETQRAGSPGKLAFSVVKDQALNFEEGDAIRMDVDSTPVFYGFVFQKKRTKDGIISVTAYDQIKYLSKNKDTYVYAGKTATQVIKMIVDDFQLRSGVLADTGYTLPATAAADQSLLDIIQEALDTTLMGTGKMYVLYDDVGKLTLKNIASLQIGLLIDADTAQNFDYTSSIDGETYNKIKLTYDNEETGKREVYISQDSANINTWGILQYYESLSDPTGAKDKANKLLELYNTKTRNLKVQDAFGDIRVKGGFSVMVQLDLGDVIVSQFMVVEHVTHTFNNDLHTMNLTLRGGAFSA